MTLEYVVEKLTSYDDEEPYWRHYIVDADSKRAYGYINAPTAKCCIYDAIPYGGNDRHYLTLEAAKDYLETVTEEQVAVELAAFRNMASLSVPEPTPKWPSRLWDKAATVKILRDVL